MQVSACSMGPQFHELNSLKAQTHYWALFGVFIPFIPDTTVGRKHFRMLISKAIKAGTSQAIFAFNKEPQRHRQFAESFLVSLDRRKSRDQIAFTVRRAARIQAAIENGS